MNESLSVDAEPGQLESNSETPLPQFERPGSAKIIQSTRALTGAMMGAFLAASVGFTNPAHAANELAMYDTQWSGAPIERAWESPGPGADFYAAMVLARLVQAQLLPPGTSLDSAVPAKIRARVDADNYGALFSKLFQDVDGDGLFELDPLRWSQVLDIDARDLTRALSTPLAPSRLRAYRRADAIRAALANVGFDPSDVPNGILMSDLIPPSDLGLEGRTQMQRYQQQVYLRLGAILEDLNRNGKLDPEDRLHSLDDAGRPISQSYGSLSEIYRGLIELNQAITQTVLEYQEQRHTSYGTGVGFSGVQWDTGRSKETVNSKIWDLERPRHGSDATWVLRPGVRPSEAIRDVLFVSSEEYMTDCAQMRTVLALGGLIEYETSRLGDEAGRYAFDARFAKTEDMRNAARAHLEAFIEARAEDPRIDWASFSRRRPAPALVFGLSINRHHIFRGSVPKNLGALTMSLAVEPWHLSETLPKGPGDDGYVANLGATVHSARLGYVGENVIQMGYVDGVESAWGHPSGSVSVAGWEASVGGQGRFQSMSSFASRFDTEPYIRWINSDTGQDIDRFKARIEELERDHPPGWERSLRVAKRYLAINIAKRTVRLAMAEDIDADQVGGLKKLLDEGQLGQSVEQALPLVRALTESGRAKLVEAFSNLTPHFEAEEIASQLSAGHSEALSDEERAALAINFSIAELGFMPIEFRAEADELVRIAEFQSQSHLLGYDLNQRVSGGLSGRDALASWLPTEDFGRWYQSRTGKPYSGPRRIEDMTLEDVRHLIVTAFPATDWMRTVYGEINDTNDKLSDQMAQALYFGRIKGGEFQPFHATRSPAD